MMYLIYLRLAAAEDRFSMYENPSRAGLHTRITYAYARLGRLLIAADCGRVRNIMARKSAKLPYANTLGKREIVDGMLAQRMSVADVAKAIGATREEMDEHYGDLIESHSAVEYFPNEEDRLMVWRAVAMGAALESIALRLGVSVAILKRSFPRELQVAKDEWMDMLSNNLTQQAINGNVQAGIFLLKTKAGFKETAVNEMTGPNGAPLAAVINVTVGKDSE